MQSSSEYFSIATPSLKSGIEQRQMQLSDRYEMLQVESGQEPGQSEIVARKRP